MKKCDVCNVAMIEETNLHTDLVGGASFDEQIHLTYTDEENGKPLLFGGQKKTTKRVKARICPNCGKVELYVDLNEKNSKSCITSLI